MAASTALGDVELTLSYDDLGNCKDTIKLSVIVADLDIDSDNNDLIGLPARTSQEEVLEDKTYELDADGQPSLEKPIPGKLLWTNTVDVDKDGVPDFADGYDYDGGSSGPEQQADNANASATFIPLVLEVSQWINLTEAEITFDYNAFDPMWEGLRTGSQPPYTYHRPSTRGLLRVWQKNANANRNGMAINDEGNEGDFIPANEPFDANLLEFSSDGKITVYIESITPGYHVGGESVTITLRPKLDEQGQPLGGIPYILTDTVRSSALETSLVKFVGGQQITPVLDIDYSTSAPTVHLTSHLVTNLRPSGEELLGDIHIEGTVESDLCDAVPGAEGRIDQVKVYLNGTQSALSTIALSVTKGESPNDWRRPYPYVGTFSATLSGVVLHQGANLIRVSASDKIIGATGFSEFGFGVRVVAPTRASVDLTAYSLTVDFDGATALSEVDPSTPVAVAATYNGFAFNDTFHQSVDNPLKFVDSLGTTWIEFSSEAELNAAMADDHRGLVEAAVLIPSLVPFPVPLPLKETTDDSSAFTTHLVGMGVALSGFSDAAVDTLVARVRKNGGSWHTEQLTETGLTTRIFTNASADFTVNIIDGGGDGAGVLSATVSHDALGISGEQTSLLESATAEGEYETIPPTYTDPTSESLADCDISVGEVPALVEKSQKGELTIVGVQFQGSPELLRQTNSATVLWEDRPLRVLEYQEGVFWRAKPI